MTKVRYGKINIIFAAIAPTNQAKCMICKEPIKKGDVKLYIEYHGDVFHRHGVLETYSKKSCCQSRAPKYLERDNIKYRFDMKTILNEATDRLKAKNNWLMHEFQKEINFINKL